jgi:hypothetical protein
VKDLQPFEIAPKRSITALTDTTHHFVFIGLQYTTPAVAIWMALTRHRPLVPVGTLNAMGVNEGIGVLAVVATAPSPTSM